MSLPTIGISSSGLLKNTRRAVTLEWQEISGAWKYELELTPIKDGQPIPNKLLRFKTGKNFWDGYVAPGLYSMRLRSLDWRGVPGAWSESEEVTIRFQKIGDFQPTHQLVINSEDSNEENVKFSWTGFPGAMSFQVSVWSKNKAINLTQETPKTELTIKLPVAQEYQWTVHPIKVKGVESDPNEDVLDFSVVGRPLDSVKIESPDDDFVQQIEWQDVAFKDNYDVVLEMKTNDGKWLEKIKRSQKETIFDLPATLEGGAYRLTVVANGIKRLSSAPSKIEFKLREGDRSPLAKAKYLFLQAKRRTNNWFILGSYLLTQMEYSSVNYDLGSKPQAKVLGGTGRLGVGFLNEKLAWGFLGIIDESGFIFDNKNYLFPALEAMTVYRASIRFDTETRFSAGVFYKELPEILYYSHKAPIITQLKTFGPQFGIEHLIYINEKWGAQLNGRIYLPTGGSTPNKLPIAMTPSFQVGAMGSLRFRKNAWGHAGYAYRKDQIQYKSSANVDSKNSTSIIGHYLNLYLEWGL